LAYSGIIHYETEAVSKPPQIIFHHFMENLKFLHQYFQMIKLFQ